MCCHHSFTNQTASRKVTPPLKSSNVTVVSFGNKNKSPLLVLVKLETDFFQVIPIVSSDADYVRKASQIFMLVKQLRTMFHSDLLT